MRSGIWRLLSFVPTATIHSTNKRRDAKSGHLRLALTHVADALAGDRLRVGRVVEDLDRHPARVTALLQRPENRHEVRLPEAGAATVDVVGVEVAGLGPVATDQLRRRAV